MSRQIDRRVFLRKAGAVAAGLGAVSASTRHGVAAAKQIVPDHNQKACYSFRNRVMY